MNGRALLSAGRYVAARSELSHAVEVLRPEPDEDTVRALSNLAGLEVRSGNLVEGDLLATEGLALGQALDVGASDLASLFVVRGIAAVASNRLTEGAGYCQTAARLAERVGDLGILSRAQLNLADALVRSDPESAVEAARSAAAHARRTGQRDRLGVAVANQVMALIELDLWDEADAVSHEALEVEHLGHELVQCVAGFLAGLRGDGDRAVAALEAAPGYSKSEDPQARAAVGIVEAFAALCTGDLEGALSHAMEVLDKREALGIGHDFERWSWPVAARAARSLENKAALGALLAMLETQPVGHLPPVLLAERQLVSALIGADANEPGAVTLVQAAISALRLGSHYQLAHGLIDYAEVLLRSGDEGADTALSEARAIGERLRCKPLLGRADSVGTSAPADARR